MITDFHAKYYAHELSRMGGAGEERAIETDVGHPGGDKWQRICFL